MLVVADGVLAVLVLGTDVPPQGLKDAVGLKKGAEEEEEEEGLDGNTWTERESLKSVTFVTSDLQHRKREAHWTVMKTRFVIRF